MSNFTPGEITYLTSQRLGRLATVSEAGGPHVVPVGFRYNAEFDTIDIGGRNFGKSRKYRDAMRHGKVAFVVDDVLPPWKPRGIEIRGRVEAFSEGGQNILSSFDPEFMRIHPTRIVSWGIDGDAFHANSRAVK